MLGLQNGIDSTPANPIAAGSANHIVPVDGWGDAECVNLCSFQPIDQSEDLFRVLREYHVGDEVTLSILRDGSPPQMTITLQARPAVQP